MDFTDSLDRVEVVDSRVDSNLIQDSDAGSVVADVSRFW